MQVMFVGRSAFAIRLAVAIVLPVLPQMATVPAVAQPAAKGQWSPVFPTPNVLIHAHLLPSGKVLFWSRREAGEGLNPRDCQPRLWDPAMGTGAGAFSPTLNTPKFNLFCSGHTFLPDGRLFVVGGHIMDGMGETHATIYDPMTNMWSLPGQVPDTIGGRWYPTAISLPDGGVLVSFGNDKTGQPNNTQEIFKDGQFMPNQVFNFPMGVPPYYPRMHVVSDGRIFMSGPLALTQFLDTTSKQWAFLHPDPDIQKALQLSSRANNFRDYAPSVLYDIDKFIFIGGGNAPTKAAETLDLSDPSLSWKKTDDMNFARRQHNATLLPDGTVLVMGGTQGNGGESNGFNDLTPGQPIHSAELWDPKTGHWKLLAKAAVDRCYHSTAVLLPDATVLNSGGGEYSPKNNGQENDPKDSHRDAQIFSPPYLFKADGSLADRPDITSAPADVAYGATITVGTSHPDQIDKVNWIRASSVTHSFNTNQRLLKSTFTAGAAGLSVTAPADPKVCPPGHYLLFLLNKDGVPSVAKIIQIHP
jgi:galactose oxidase